MEAYKKEKEINQRRKEENLSLASKGLDCNGEKVDLENDDTEESEVLCKFCKQRFESASILKHIGNNEECKLFYGPRFEAMKKDHKRQRMQWQREEKGTEKELEKQRIAYALNSGIRQKKKDYYIEDKKNQAILQLEKEKERRKDDAKKMIIRWEDENRRMNKQKYQVFKWIIDFLQHLFEIFKDICTNIKKKLISLIRSIEEKYKKNETEIDTMTKNAKENADKYNGDPYPNHFKIEKFFQKDEKNVKQHQENNWSNMKKTVEVQLVQICEQVHDHHKLKEWYCTLAKIKDVYKETIVPGWFEGKYYLSGKVCFICRDEGHRIDFDCHTIYRLKNQPKN